MTQYQTNLLREARDFWENGHPIPLDLYARLAGEGFDVPALEAKYQTYE